MDDFRQHLLNRLDVIGINQKEVDRRTKKSRGWFSRFLSGERQDVKLETFIALAHALEMSPVELMRVYTGGDSKASLSDYQRGVKLLLNALPKEELSKLLV